MPLTFTAPIEEIPGLIALTLQSSDRKSALELLSTSASALRRTGLQRQGMKLTAHFALERLIDDLVLLDARLAAKRFGDDGRGVMVAVTCQIADRYLRIRYAGADQALDIARSHRHVVVTGPWPIARPEHSNLCNVATTMRRVAANVNVASASGAYSRASGKSLFM